MAKRIIRLTESELIEHIRNVVNEAMNEMDGKTHARVKSAEYLYHTCEESS